MEKVITDAVEVIKDTTVELTTALPEVNVDVRQSITAEVQPDTYVIASTGYSGGVPGWIANYVSNLVQESIGTGGTLADMLNLIRTNLMDEIQLGVNQAISQIENAYVSNSTFTTTLASEIGTSRAAILDTVQTYADHTQAYATEVNALKATFGGDFNNAEAFIGSVALAYANDKYATAATYDTLAATYNDLAVTLNGTRNVVAGETDIWDGNGTPAFGQAYEFSDGWKKYFGEFTGWVKTTDMTAYGWAAGASSFITAPDGSITGWAFADGSDSESTFKIKAQNFEISNGVNGYTPFSISGNKINFNGMVSFSNITGGESILTTGEAAADINTNTTTINGGKITTGSITAGQINVGSVQAATVTASYINALNIVADSVDARWVYAGNINAGNITAGTLNVGVINSGSLTSAKGPVTVSFSKFGPSNGSTTLATITASNSSGSLNMLVLNIEVRFDPRASGVMRAVQVVIMQDGVVKLSRFTPSSLIEVPTYLDISYTTPGNNSVFTVATVYDLAESNESHQRDTLSVTGSVSLIEFKK